MQLPGKVLHLVERLLPDCRKVKSIGVPLQVAGMSMGGSFSISSTHGGRVREGEERTDGSESELKSGPFGLPNLGRAEGVGTEL